MGYMSLNTNTQNTIRKYLPFKTQTMTKLNYHTSQWQTPDYSRLHDCSLLKSRSNLDLIWFMIQYSMVMWKQTAFLSSSDPLNAPHVFPRCPTTARTQLSLGREQPPSPSFALTEPPLLWMAPLTWRFMEVELRVGQKRVLCLHCINSNCPGCIHVVSSAWGPERSTCTSTFYSLP